MCNSLADHLAPYLLSDCFLCQHWQSFMIISYLWTTHEQVFSGQPFHWLSLKVQ